MTVRILSLSGSLLDLSSWLSLWWCDPLTVGSPFTRSLTFTWLRIYLLSSLWPRISLLCDHERERDWHSIKSSQYVECVCVCLLSSHLFWASVVVKSSLRSESAGHFTKKEKKRKKFTAPEKCISLGQTVRLLTVASPCFRTRYSIVLLGSSSILIVDRSTQKKTTKRWLFILLHTCNK